MRFLLLSLFLLIPLPAAMACQTQAEKTINKIDGKPDDGSLPCWETMVTDTSGNPLPNKSDWSTKTLNSNGKRIDGYEPGTRESSNVLDLRNNSEKIWVDVYDKKECQGIERYSPSCKSN